MRWLTSGSVYDVAAESILVPRVGEPMLSIVYSVSFGRRSYLVSLSGMTDKTGGKQVLRLINCMECLHPTRENYAKLPQPTYILLPHCQLLLSLFTSFNLQLLLTITHFHFSLGNKMLCLLECTTIMKYCFVSLSTVTCG
jgi:hypothetical protein